MENASYNDYDRGLVLVFSLPNSPIVSKWNEVYECKSFYNGERIDGEVKCH